MKWKRQVFLVLTFALLAVGPLLQHASGITTERGSQRTANVDRPAVYVARVLSVSAEARNAFVSCLRQQALPVWQRMSHLAASATPDTFFEAEQKRERTQPPGTRCEEVPGV
jgi:hypothetical protein